MPIAILVNFKYANFLSLATSHLCLTLQLSQKAKELIPKARILSLAAWEGSHSRAEI
jgi:hypothetical protein